MHGKTPGTGVDEPDPDAEVLSRRFNSADAKAAAQHADSSDPDVASHLPLDPHDATALVEHVRSAMREFPQPLVVVSAQPDDPSSPPHGMLVSSFRTVLLQPRPYISFVVRLPSRTHAAILAASGRFQVSAITDEATAICAFLIAGRNRTCARPRSG